MLQKIYLWLFVDKRDIGEINIGVLQEIIKQACLLPDTMMASRPPPPPTPHILIQASARLLTADKFIKDSPTKAPEKFDPVSTC